MGKSTLHLWPDPFTRPLLYLIPAVVILFITAIILSVFSHSHPALPLISNIIQTLIFATPILYLAIYFYCRTALSSISLLHVNPDEIHFGLTTLAVKDVNRLILLDEGNGPARTLGFATRQSPSNISWFLIDDLIACEAATKLSLCLGIPLDCLIGTRIDAACSQPVFTSTPSAYRSLIQAACNATSSDNHILYQKVPILHPSPAGFTVDLPDRDKYFASQKNYLFYTRITIIVLGIIAAIVSYPLAQTWKAPAIAAGCALWMLFSIELATWVHKSKKKFLPTTFNLTSDQPSVTVPLAHTFPVHEITGVVVYWVDAPGTTRESGASYSVLLARTLPDSKPLFTVVANVSCTTRARKQTFQLACDLAAALAIPAYYAQLADGYDLVPSVPFTGKTPIPVATA